MHGAGQPWFGFFGQFEEWDRGGRIVGLLPGLFIWGLPGLSRG